MRRAVRPRGAPSEIAYDYWSTVRSLEAIGHRPAFGLNRDPSHMPWQDLDPVGFITDFADRTYHVDCKDTRMRGWDFVSAGRGDVPWEDCYLRALDFPPATASFDAAFKQD